MLPTVAPRVQTPQAQRPNTAFRTVFLAHLGVSRVRAAITKTAPSISISMPDLGEFEFFTPPSCLCAALVLDIDRPEAVLEIFETFPSEIHPSWVVETPKGAQAGWFIDPVDLRPTARDHPIRFARAIGTALRIAVGGDAAVDPVSPSRIRNPAYHGAELRAAPTPPVYRLGALHEALKTAGLWNTATPTRSDNITKATVPIGAIAEGSRNVTIFDACRYAAYSGADYETAAWEANDHCTIPLPAAEVTGIIRSVTRFMERTPGKSRTGTTSPMPTVMHQALSEMGRRGGRANTPAQRAARALGTAASVTARKDATDRKAQQAQRMAARGYTRRQITQKLCVSAATVCRWLRRYVACQLPRFINGASGDPRPPRRHPQFWSPQLCAHQQAGRRDPRCPGGHSDSAKDPP